MARGGKGLGVGDITVLNNSHLDDEDREVQFYIHGNYDLWWHQSQIDFFFLRCNFLILVSSMVQLQRSICFDKASGVARSWLASLTQ